MQRPSGLVRDEIGPALRPFFFALFCAFSRLFLFFAIFAFFRR
jgi:hypothetical protein